MKKLIGILNFILCIVFANAQTDSNIIQKETSDTINLGYDFVAGTMPNMESGVLSCYSASHLIFDLESKFINRGKHNTKIVRVSNALFFQFFLGKELYGVFPHEFFGHYTRGLEFGMDVKAIHLRFPGIGGYTTANINHSVPVKQRLLWAAAGSEAQSVISFITERDLYSGSYVPTYQANPIFFNKLFMLLYYKEDLNFFVKNPDQFVKDGLKGGDFSNYSFSLAESYGLYPGIKSNSKWFSFPDDPKSLNIDFVKDQNKRIKQTYLLSLLDMGLFEFFSGNYQYINKGKIFYKPFMFEIKKIKFMPSVRSNMGEIGAENYFDLMVSSPHLPQLNIYYRKGGNLFDEINGIGACVKGMQIGNVLQIMSQLDYWQKRQNSKAGFNAFADFKIGYPEKLYFILGVGYKTEGGLIGKPYNSGIYGYCGIGIAPNIN